MSADRVAIVTDQQFRQHRFVAPPGACQIILVRHGESAAAEPDRDFPLVDGHGDPSLHPNGERQAERVGERLANEPIEAIYVTSLTRTHQTAAPLATRLGLTPIVEPDLREVFLGDWEGGEFRRRIAAGDPIAARVHSEERWDVIPNAEPAADFRSRIRASIERIAAKHPDQVVVVVVHGGVIGEALNMAAGTTGFAFTWSDNASISHLVIDGDRWILRRFNDTSHLSDSLLSVPDLSELPA